MAIFPNPDSRHCRAIRCLAGFAAILPLAPLQADIPFAEELFPQLASLMDTAAREGTTLQLSELRLEEREGDLQAVQARSQFQVYATARVAGAYEVREDIDDRFRGNVDARVNLSKPIYHWGNMKRQETVAESRIALEEVESTDRGARHFMAIRRAYLEWLLMQERMRILEQSISLSESFVDARRQLVEAGQSSEQDVLEMEARLLENHESLAFVVRRGSDLESQLRRLVGPSFRRDNLETATLTIIEPMDMVAFDQLVERATGTNASMFNPSIERFSVLEDIESENLGILNRSNRPNVDLVAGIFSDYLDSINQKDFVLRIQYYAGVQVNWSIFDGWQTDAWKRSSLARKRAYALQEEAAKDETRQRIETLLAELRLNLKQMEARGKREIILDRRVNFLREQADRNQITGVDRIEGEIDYLEVRQRLMEARVNYLMNLMELGLLLGEDPAASYYRTES